MVIKLYTMDLSPPVRSAMMGFEIFNVPYEKIEVDLQAFEHKTPEYLKVSISCKRGGCILPIFAHIWLISFVLKK